jgi:hypothetical protein
MSGASNPEKQQLAIQLLSSSIEKKNGAISIQVLQEYFVTSVMRTVAARRQ